MPQNKKHHYVPRFYLQQFSEDGRRINLFNIPAQRTIFGASLRGQCYRCYFYGRNSNIEKMLADVEAKASIILREIARDRVLPMQASEDHQYLFLFLLMQCARTSYQTDLIEERHDAFWRHAVLPYVDQSQGALPDNPPRCREPGTYALRTAFGFLPVIFDLDYKLLSIADDQEFIASDNPVVLYNQMYEFVRIGGTTGIANKGLQIFFPIDRKNLLMVYDSRVYSVGKMRERVVPVAGDHDVGQLNLLQFVSAQCNVYFHGPGSAMEILHKRALKYYRKEKSRTHVFGPKSTVPGNQLILTTDVDVQTDLRLSFVRIVKRERLWLTNLRRSKGRAVPMPVKRDKALVDMNMEFMQAVDEGKCKFEDINSWFEERIKKRMS